MTTDPDDILRTMRRAIVLLTLENCNVTALLNDGISDHRRLSPTAKKAVRAATALGIAERGPGGSIRWSETYRAVTTKPADWKQFLAVLRHHITYLSLVRSEASPQVGQSAAQTQITTNIGEYHAYLLGVAESHRDRAFSLATLNELSAPRHLVDLGGGLGAYSKAWVDSDPRRTATLVDLPAVTTLAAATPLGHNSQVTFHAADLTRLDTLPTGDLYLLANVLHLFRNWRFVLRSILSLIPPQALIAILEAKATGSAGAFFDLQVHLRAFRQGGLISPLSLDRILKDSYSGTLKVFRRQLDLVNDPLGRDYWLWIAGSHCQE